MSEQQPLRVVLILEGSRLPAWQCYLLEQLVFLPQVQVVMVLSASHAAMPARLAAVGLRWLRALDAFLFRVGWDAQKHLDVSTVLSDIPWLAWGSPDIEGAVEALDPDVILDLSANDQWPEWLYTRSRQGVWHCLYGDACRNMDWAGVSAYAQGEKEIRAAIGRRLRAGQALQLLFVSEGSTDLSLSQTMNALVWKLAARVPDMLITLHAEPDRFFRTIRLRSETGLPVRMTGLPDESALLVAASKAFIRQVVRYLMTKLLYQRHWVLLTRPMTHPLQTLSDLTQALPLMPPPGYFWADPCLLEHEGRLFVFFEEYVFEQNKGRLACIELDDAGAYSAARTVLELPYHLSYPFLFHYQGDLYLIPESAENRTIDVYRCERFPDRWEPVCTLMSGVDAYDATLHFHAGRWWMFVNLRGHPGSSPHDLLYLFSAETPLSDTWEPHPCNPIISQAASARPAGALFEHEGVIYRPSQNCAGSYGRGLNLNQVIEWNSERYIEKVVDQCIPAGKEGLEGIHTFSFVHGRVVSDGIYVRKRWKERHD